MAVEWTIESLGDLDRIWQFHAQSDPDRADRLDREFAERALRLSLTPFIGRPGRHGVREYSMTDIQYVFAYLVEDGGIRILRVWSTRERA